MHVAAEGHLASLMPESMIATNTYTYKKLRLIIHVI
jgi:hypothetical protein